MDIVYLSNFFNHHQKPLADEFYQSTNHHFWFVETQPMPESFKKTGYTEYKEPYVLRYSDDNKENIEQLILEADAVIIGQAPTSMIKKRVEKGKLLFRVSERRYKSLLRYLKWPIYTYQSLLYNRGYLLAASAYAARDYALSGMKADKCYKWGYFTEFKTYESIESLMAMKSQSREKNMSVSILWACRLIGWKHPEMAVKLAKRLKDDGYRFKMKIAGRGPLEGALQAMINDYGIADYVSLIGPQKQEVLRTLMEKCDIFLATSDQNEGWGATVNESMNSGCAVVASHAIGAVPFLIEDGKNGLVFKSKDVDSLYSKVIWLIEHPDEISKLGRNAYYTMRDVWNADVASSNLLKLVEALKKGIEPDIQYGPCSRAEIINHTDYNQANARSCLVEK